MERLHWHKPRLVILGPKIEAFPDSHSSRHFVYGLSHNFSSVGNSIECKRLLTHSLKLWREQGDDLQAAQALSTLCEANRRMGPYKDGIPQAKEASEIFERLDCAVEQAGCLIILASSLCNDNQLDAAEGAVLRAIELSPEKEDLQMHKLTLNTPSRTWSTTRTLWPR